MFNFGGSSYLSCLRSISHLFGEEKGTDLRQQVFEDQSHSWIHWIVTDDDSVIGTQEHTPNHLLATLLETVLWYRQVSLHGSACFLFQDDGEITLALGKDTLSCLHISLSDFDIDISLHHPQHTLNLTICTWTISFWRYSWYLTESPTIYLNFSLT